MYRGCRLSSIEDDDDEDEDDEDDEHSSLSHDELLSIVSVGFRFHGQKKQSSYSKNEMSLR